MKVEQFLYGKNKDGREVPAFTVTNAKGAYIELVSYGATLNKIVVPDRNGALYDVLVGFDTMEQKENAPTPKAARSAELPTALPAAELRLTAKITRLPKM